MAKVQLPLSDKPSDRRRPRWPLFMAMLATVALGVPALAGAWSLRDIDDFDRTGELIAGGKKVQVSGPLSDAGDCEPGEPATHFVTITQWEEGVVAKDRWRGECQSATEPSFWKTTARVTVGDRLKKGKAKACALGIYRGLDGEVQLADQWCRVIRLK